MDNGEFIGMDAIFAYKHRHNRGPDKGMSES